MIPDILWYSICGDGIQDPKENGNKLKNNFHVHGFS